MKKILYIILFLPFIACSPNTTSEGNIDKDMLDAGIEVYLSYITLVVQDSANTPEEQLLDSALVQQKMDRESFNRVLDYYKNHPRAFDERLTDINEHIASLQANQK